MMKFCNGCGETKPTNEFFLDRARGRPKSQCKVCTVARTRAWRRANPDYERNRYRSEKAETRERHLLRKYGVTQADYENMLQRQDGHCAICRTTPDTQHNGVFHVDHDHATGRVRGLLCRGCNHMLGAVSDSPEALARAIAYLGVPVPQIPEILGRAIIAAEAMQRRAAA